MLLGTEFVFLSRVRRIQSGACRSLGKFRFKTLRYQLKSTIFCELIVVYVMSGINFQKISR
jgi:hypothetical protein